MLSYFFGVHSEGLKVLKDLDVKLHDEVKLLKTFAALFNQLHKYIIQNKEAKDVEQVAKELKKELSTVQKIIINIHKRLDYEGSKAYDFANYLKSHMQYNEEYYDMTCHTETYDPVNNTFTWFHNHDKKVEDPESIKNYRVVFYLLDTLRAFSEKSLDKLRSILDKKIAKKEDVLQIALWMMDELSKAKSLSSNIEKLIPVFEDHIKAESTENKNAQEAKKLVMSNDEILNTKNLVFHGLSSSGLGKASRIFKYGIMSHGLYKRVFGTDLKHGWSSSYSENTHDVDKAENVTYDNNERAGIYSYPEPAGYMKTYDDSNKIQRGSSFVCVWSLWKNPIPSKEDITLPPSKKAYDIFRNGPFSFFFIVSSKRKLFVVTHQNLLYYEVHLFGRVKPKEIIGVCTKWNIRNRPYEFFALLKLCMKNKRPLYYIKNDSESKTCTLELVWPR